MPPSYSIRLKGQTVAYRITPTTRSRRMSLRVTDEGLSVRVPGGVSPGQAVRLIEKNADWVLRQLEKHAARQREVRLEVAGRPAILFKGEAVAVYQAPALKRVMLADEGLVIRHGLKDPERALEDWLREECRTALAAPLARAEGLTGHRHSGLTIRGQKSRWGSCSSTGALSFNWRLIMAPEDVLDYVACHEVAHLSIANHSPAFWDLVGAICPHAKWARGWLKEYQHHLMAPLSRLFEPPHSPREPAA